MTVVDARDGNRLIVVGRFLLTEVCISTFADFLKVTISPHFTWTWTTPELRHIVRASYVNAIVSVCTLVVMSPDAKR